jgi:hypothetical protein
MAKEKVYSEVLNLRVDEAMSAEIKRIAGMEGSPESETARSLIGWGITAHRAREAALLRLPYDSGPPEDHFGPMALVVTAQWVSDPPYDIDA